MQNLNLPETGFVRLQTILQFIPVSQTTWRQGVKDGVFTPFQPVKGGYNPPQPDA